MSKGDSVQQIEFPFSSLLNRTIQDVYHLSHSTSHPQFKDNVLDLIGQLIKCDNVHWITLANFDDRKTSSIVSRQHSFAKSSSKNDSQQIDIDGLLGALPYWQEGETFTITTPLNQKDRTPDAKYCVESNPANINNPNNVANNVANIQLHSNTDQIALVTILFNQVSQLYDILIITRENDKAHFSTEERLTTQYFLPHIGEAYRINLLHNRLINDFTASTAVCDMNGHLLLADDKFEITLSNLHTESKGKDIPEDVFQSLLDNTPVIYGRNRIILKAKIIDNLAYVDFLEDRRSGGLSKKERLVTKFMIQGMNHIEIAKKLDVPVSGILYVVNCVFKKLGVKNKAELNMKYASKQPNLQLQTFCCPVTS